MDKAFMVYKEEITFEISRNEAMRAVIEAINRDEISKANSIINLISRTIMEEKKRKVYTNIVRLKDVDEIKLFGISQQLK